MWRGLWRRCIRPHVTKGSEGRRAAHACERNIEVAAQAVKHCVKPRIHTLISTSPVHMKYKLRKRPAQVVEMIDHSVRFARKFVNDAEWSAEDVTRTERDFLCGCVEVAIRAGATTINSPDTAGYTVPEEFTEIISMLRARAGGGKGHLLHPLPQRPRAWRRACIAPSLATCKREQGPLSRGKSGDGISRWFKGGHFACDETGKGVRNAFGRTKGSSPEEFDYAQGIDFATGNNAPGA